MVSALWAKINDHFLKAARDDIDIWKNLPRLCQKLGGTVMRTISFFLQLIAATIILLNTESATAVQNDLTTSSCLACHGDIQKMKELGFPRLTLTQQDAEKQTRMPATCVDCHLGNPADQTKDGAHKGLLRLYAVSTKEFQTETRDKLFNFKPEVLEPKGKNQMTNLLPLVNKDGKMVKDPEINTILYHDKNPADLSFNYPVLKKTCGVCHAQQVEELKKTAMGQNAKQRLYRTWTGKQGPHNCGVWFAEGYDEIAQNTNLPFSKETAHINQKACNTCHTGCMDCHYTPKRNNQKDPAAGSHTFTKNVASETCYGGGRGSICHAGPEDRRRGAGYIGGDFANPTGAVPDVHYARGIGCTDCHDTARSDKQLLHGQVKRQVNCAKCHESVIKSSAASVHAKLTCGACHIQNVGAYTATFWGPGKIAGVKTPYMKYKEYYGIMKEPILIRDQKGLWIPVKPYAMAALNQKSAGDLKPGLSWRFPVTVPDLERTDDAYAFVGLLNGLPENNNALAWIQMDKLSHKYSSARRCESCHTMDGGQRQEVSWKYDDQGAEPFDGRHTVIADKDGLFIMDMKVTSAIKVKEGWKLSDFAPWYYLKDKWLVKGDFSIPMVMNRAVYEIGRKQYEEGLKSGSKYHQ